MGTRSSEDILKSLGVSLSQFGLFPPNEGLTWNKFTQLYQNDTMNEDRLAALLAEEWGVEQVFPTREWYDLALLEDLPSNLSKGDVLPIINTKEEIVIAFPIIPEQSILDCLQAHYGKVVRPVIAAHNRIKAISSSVSSTKTNSGASSFLKLIRDSDFLEEILVSCAAGGPGELYLEAIQEEVQVRWRSNFSSSEITRQPVKKLHKLFQGILRVVGPGNESREMRHVGGVCTSLDDQAMHLEFRILKDSLGPVIHISINKNVCPCCRSQLTLPADLNSQFAKLQPLRRGLVLCSHRDPEIAQKFAFSLAKEHSPDSKQIAIVGGCRFQDESKFRELTTLKKAAALDLDVWVVGPVTHKEEFQLVLKESVRRLIFIVSEDVSPLTAILGCLEIGARPSVLAYVLRCSIFLDGQDFELLIPDTGLRQLIAADCRRDIVEKLWNGKWEAQCWT